MNRGSIFRIRRHSGYKYAFSKSWGAGNDSFTSNVVSSWTHIEESVSVAYVNAHSWTETIPRSNSWEWDQPLSWNGRH